MLFLGQDCECWKNPKLFESSRAVRCILCVKRNLLKARDHDGLKIRLVEPMDYHCGNGPVEYTDRPVKVQHVDEKWSEVTLGVVDRKNTAGFYTFTRSRLEVKWHDQVLFTSCYVRCDPPEAKEKIGKTYLPVQISLFF